MTITHEEAIDIHLRERARHQAVPPSEDRREAEMARYASWNLSDEDAASIYERDATGGCWPYGPPWGILTQSELEGRGAPPGGHKYAIRIQYLRDLLAGAERDGDDQGAEIFRAELRELEADYQDLGG